VSFSDHVGASCPGDRANEEDPQMGIVDIDHVAVPTARPEEMLRFYRALGFSAPTPEKWRERGLPFFALSLGDTKINVHAPELGGATGCSGSSG
jgi:hypothetical protein